MNIEEQIDERIKEYLKNHLRLHVSSESEYTFDGSIKRTHSISLILDGEHVDTVYID